MKLQHTQRTLKKPQQRNRNQGTETKSCTTGEKHRSGQTLKPQQAKQPKSKTKLKKQITSAKPDPKQKTTTVQPHTAETKT